MGPRRTPVTARAFAPGHLTGFFAPDLNSKDPRGRGSRGAGIVLDRGVIATARYDPRGPSRTRVTSTPRVPVPISREVAVRLRAGLPGALSVELRHDLPIGQGLGMSAAGAVATGLAVAHVVEIPESRAWEVAHLSDLFHGGGLGGVAALRKGGLETRIRPGIPPWGTSRHWAWNGPVRIYRAAGPRPSPRLLRDPAFLRRVARAGARSVPAFLRDPSLRTFLREAERFTDRIDLGPPRVTRWVHSLRSPEIACAQAMFGGLVYAIPRNGRSFPEPPLAGRTRPPDRWMTVSGGRLGAHLIGRVRR